MRHEDVGKWANRNGKFVKIRDKVVLRKACYAPPRSVRGSDGVWKDRATGQYFRSVEQRRQYLDRNGLIELGIGSDLPDMPEDFNGDIPMESLKKMEELE